MGQSAATVATAGPRPAARQQPQRRQSLERQRRRPATRQLARPLRPRLRQHRPNHGPQPRRHHRPVGAYRRISRPRCCTGGGQGKTAESMNQDSAPSSEVASMKWAGREHEKPQALVGCCIRELSRISREVKVAPR